MKTAYIVVAHKNPEQIRRLAAALKNADAHFFLHLDRKADKAPFADALLHSENPNVTFVEPRIAVRWGAFSLVRAILSSIDEVLRTDVPFDYVILMSGQCYPIKPHRQIRDFLRDHDGKQIISALSTRNTWTRAAGRYERYYLNEWPHPLVQKLLAVANRLLPKRRFVPGMEPYGGSHHFFLTRDCAAHIAREARDNRRYRRFFQLSEQPAEMFFHTLVMNSPFADDLLNWNPWLIKWTPPAGNPHVLRSDNLPEIRASDKLFARKFDIERDASVFDALDEIVLRK